jgi:drug/metabolite transporter (DMT)-like permease
MRFTAWLVLLATLLLWSGNWIVARAVRDEVAPGFATMGRQLIVLAFLLPFVAGGLASKLSRLTRRDWAVAAGLGVTGGGVHLALQWLAMHYTTAASGMLFLSTSPIFTLLFAIPLGEQVTRRQWTGVAISFAGVFLIATQGDASRLSLNVGDLLACTSMALWAGYTNLLRLRRDPLGVLELLVLVCAFGFLSMVPWVAWEYLTGAKIALTLNGGMAMAYSGIASLLLAYAGWSYVVARLGPTRAGATMHLMPAIGILLSAVLLREYPLWYHFAGIGLILAGVALSTLRRRGVSAPATR